MWYATPDFVAEVRQQCSASFLRFFRILLLTMVSWLRSCLKRVVLVSLLVSTDVSTIIEADELADVEQSS
jgi:hypothetical protein